MAGRYLDTLLPASRAPAGAQCSAHADRPAAAICERCGRFTCAAESIVYKGRSWCPKCCEFPDVEWLEQYKRQLAGRWSISVLVAAVASFGLVAASVGSIVIVLRDPPPVALARNAPWFLLSDALVAAVLAVPLLRRNAAVRTPWTVAVLAWSAVLVGVLWSSLGTHAVRGLLVPEYLIYGVGWLFGLFALVRTTGARLFFGLPVSRTVLLQLYVSSRNNPLAILAVLLSMAGVVVPFLFLLALFVALKASRAIDPAAHPPVEGKGDVLLARVLSIVGALTTLGWIAYWVLG